MNVRLNAYLALERVMLLLDESGDEVADAIRDQMDVLWYALTVEDHAFLDTRTICVEDSKPLRIPLPQPPTWASSTPPTTTLIRNRDVGLLVPVPSEYAA